MYEKSCASNEDCQECEGKENCYCCIGHMCNKGEEEGWLFYLKVLTLFALFSQDSYFLSVCHHEFFFYFNHAIAFYLLFFTV